MKDRAFNITIDKEKLARDIMRHGNISIKDASIILGMKTAEAFRVKLSRGSFSLEDILMLSMAAGLEMSISNTSDYIFVNDYCYNKDAEVHLTKWKDCKKEVIDAEIRRLQALKDSIKIGR